MSAFAPGANPPGTRPPITQAESNEMYENAKRVEEEKRRKELEENPELANKLPELIFCKCSGVRLHKGDPAKKNSSHEKLGP